MMTFRCAPSIFKFGKKKEEIPDEYTLAFREMVEKPIPKQKSYLNFIGYTLQRKDSPAIHANMENYSLGQKQTARVYFRKEDAEYERNLMRDSSGWYIVEVALFTNDPDFDYKNFLEKKE
jgi:hypothetical protein